MKSAYHSLSASDRMNWLKQAKESGMSYRQAIDYYNQDDKEINKFQKGGKVEGYNEDIDYLGTNYKDLGFTKSFSKFNVSGGNYIPQKSYTELEKQKLFNPHLNIEIPLRNNFSINGEYGIPTRYNDSYFNAGVKYTFQKGGKVLPNKSLEFSDSYYPSRTGEDYTEGTLVNNTNLHFNYSPIKNFKPFELTGDINGNKTDNNYNYDIKTGFKLGTDFTKNTPDNKNQTVWNIGGSEVKAGLKINDNNKLNPYFGGQVQFNANLVENKNNQLSLNIIPYKFYIEPNLYKKEYNNQLNGDESGIGLTENFKKYNLKVNTKAFYNYENNQPEYNVGISKTFNNREKDWKYNGSHMNPRFLKNGGKIIEDNKGQWAHPGEITKINSPNITMKGVNYPVLGVSNTGHTQMMYPNQDYKFEGDSVTEYPQKFQNGGYTSEEDYKSHLLDKWSPEKAKTQLEWNTRKNNYSTQVPLQFNQKNDNINYQTEDPYKRDAYLKQSNDLKYKAYLEDQKNKADYELKIRNQIRAQNEFDKKRGVAPSLYNEDYLVNNNLSKKEYEDKLNRNTNEAMLQVGLSFLPVAGELAGAKYLPKFVKSIPEFKSEIDWKAWNKEIPENKELLNEYHTIEQTSKANNTWMKNSDGSKFEGTPEQFVQQNSKNFKKSFPNIIKNDNGYIQTNYHGSPHILDYFDPQKEINGRIYGNGLYTTPTKELALKYSTGNNPQMYELYLNANRPRNASNYLNEGVEKAENKLNSVLNMYGKDSKEYKDAINIYNDDLEYIRKNRTKIDLRKHKIDNKSTEDFMKVKDIQITPFDNYVKSMKNNNGMFDMTNPNIYKSLLALGYSSAQINYLINKNGRENN